jgi:hypothetical protein
VELMDPSELVTIPIKPSSLEDMAAEAAQEYKHGSRLEAAKLVSAILDQDFNYPAAWVLLHKWYGEGKSFRKFQLDFTLKYYPARVKNLNRAPSPVSRPQTFQSSDPGAPQSAPVSSSVLPQRGERMNFCPVCGWKNERQGRFCPLCGESLSFTSSPAADLPIPAPAPPAELAYEVDEISNEAVNDTAEPIRQEEIWIPEDQFVQPAVSDMPAAPEETSLTEKGDTPFSPPPVPEPDLPAEEELLPIAEAYINPPPNWTPESVVTTPAAEERIEKPVPLQVEENLGNVTPAEGEEYLPDWLAYSEEFLTAPSIEENQTAGEDQKTEDLPEWLTLSYEKVKEMPSLSPAGASLVPDSEPEKTFSPLMDKLPDQGEKSVQPQEGEI